MKLHKQLSLLGACHNAIEYARGRSHKKAWRKCQDDAWMLWLVDTVWPKRGKMIKDDHTPDEIRDMIPFKKLKKKLKKATKKMSKEDEKLYSDIDQLNDSLMD